MSKWQDKLDQNSGNGAGRSQDGTEADPESELTALIDRTQYRPWLLQRGRGRPAMFLDLRRFEPRSGMLLGIQMSYPHLIAVTYTGDRMLSLDFGRRQFAVEGLELAPLAQCLQHGMVLAIQEYSSLVWPQAPSGPRITRIAPLDTR